MIKNRTSFLAKLVYYVICALDFFAFQNYLKTTFRFGDNFKAKFSLLCYLFIY